MIEAGVTIRKVVLLGGVSCLALAIDTPTVTYAQTVLPPASVDAPRPRVQRAPAARQSSGARTTARRTQAARNVQPVAPVPYIVPSTGTVGTVPPAYAGGQVATGGSLGMLGNRGVMDTPFNQTSYTAELIKNQQARTIRDVLMNDPSVRVIQAAGGGADSLFIRGFYFDSGDYALNGLAGIAPYYSTSANFIERVEVLKGPSALINGMTTGGTGVSSGGAVGGSVNLITKHAPDIDITQLTATYASKTQFGAQVDVSRRYGEYKEWGVRANSSYVNGNTAWNRQKDELGNAALGLDYRGERVRVAADIGYQADNLKPPLRFFSILPTTFVPPPPEAGLNFQVPWAFYKPTDFFSTVRGEVDLTNWATGYAAFGYHDSKIDYLYPSPTITNTASNGVTPQLGGLRSNPIGGHETFETFAGETGIRATVDTGPLNHALNVNYSINDRTYRQVASNSAAGFIYWNLYNEPTNLPQPAINNLGANQKTGVTLKSVGFSDTISALNKRIQFTAGVRRQTAGVEVENYLTPASSRPETDTSVWTPAFALVVKPVENVSFYANYIQGLQTPVVVGTAFTNRGTVFPPTKTEQKEAGVKIDLGRLTTTLSFFEIEQRSVITEGTVQLLNGRQRNRGSEINIFGEVTPDFRLLGGVAIIDGRQVRTNTPANDGKVAIGVPAVQANMGAEWDTPVRNFTLSGKIIYTSSAYVNPANTVSIPEWTRVDLGARYSVISPWNGKPIDFRFNVENVANRAYWASTYSGVLTLAAPRTYLASTTFNF